ncbi:sulfite exporter TauE/SafE family protein [Bifidobacterium longum]|uniref:sulfite exporter TauE/SafE family protein n=1 Tax=Bifidobacterium longum TaxID=216816 RepID=UPI001F56D6CF|nr:sulfite exporter TauE/SafE family protein [Bifidobacterium longum]UNL66109.1 sulfite exporter TauE/SafE family protein [Bifidobacterium longum subsp. longum]UNL67925.1 sulfite exporter TauE/SafE family protein [Bifidobacterium longum subsp. longum]UNL69932.1 sulfite exporter TauE/SafE family protein [Bifidobacterium longum subsp. longum]
MIAGFSITSLLLILLAGIGAGFVGYAVGASSLVSYPALLAFGIPPVLANASNTVGVVGTGIGGVMGARKELKGQAVRSITYVVIGAFGGVAGAFLLLKLDPSVFEFAAPVLILLSSLIIAINPRGRMQAKQAAADTTAQLKHIEATEATDATDAAKRATTPTAPHRPPEQLVQPMSQDSWWVWLGVVAVAIYSGYFGAGAGTLALAMLDAAKIGPFHKINALKTLIGTGANISASVVFIIQGAVDWPAAIMLCIGCFIGGYIAPPITRKIPANIMRAAAVIAGIILTIDLGLKTY